mmetsp:Transcript_44386/g.105125  ORF Transcript_44386/g.105125 Transcript_44386/m.105125 type:complete len:241 (+) Transcript_44386:234-956(+)
MRPCAAGLRTGGFLGAAADGSSPLASVEVDSVVCSAMAVSLLSPPSLALANVAAGGGIVGPFTLRFGAAGFAVEALSGDSLAAEASLLLDASSGVAFWLAGCDDCCGFVLAFGSALGAAFGAAGLSSALASRCATLSIFSASSRRESTMANRRFSFSCFSFRRSAFMEPMKASKESSSSATAFAPEAWAFTTSTASWAERRMCSALSSFDFDSRLLRVSTPANSGKPSASICSSLAASVV